MCVRIYVYQVILTMTPGACSHATYAVVTVPTALDQNRGQQYEFWVLPSSQGAFSAELFW